MVKIGTRTCINVPVHIKMSTHEKGKSTKLIESPKTIEIKKNAKDKT